MEFPSLKSGHNGLDVIKWQKFLKAQNMMPDDPLAGAVDGNFGMGTQFGTKAYQNSKGLSPTGIVDAETYAEAVKDGFEPGKE